MSTNIAMQSDKTTPLGRAARKALRDPGFIVAAVILLIAAAGLNASVAKLRLHFQKMPVPLRRPLAALPEKIGPWVQVSKDQPLDADIEHTLATDKYIFRDYVDSRLIPASTIKQFEDKDWKQRQMMLMEIQQKKPQAVMNMAVTYYTGLVDTVAHIPDRCYIADGYEPVKWDVVTWTAFDGKQGRGVGDARFINFVDQTAERHSVPKNVLYFFHCNGEYVNNPEAVRMRLQDLRQRYGYYAKVELMTLMPDHEESGRIMNEFLGSALPEVEKCLPDWNKVSSATK